MTKFFADEVFSVYGELLTPFRDKAFGPELATLLLILALIVLIAFLSVAIPQAIRLHAALAAIKGSSKNETEPERRANFANNYEIIDAALSSNKAISGVWQEFRKSLLIHSNAQRKIILNSTPPYNFFNARNLRVHTEMSPTRFKDFWRC